MFIFGAWLAGGFYYVEIYGSEVKPFIKEGPMPWAHQVVMETKEHVFLFLPFLGLLAYGVLQRLDDTTSEDPRARTAKGVISLIIFMAVAFVFAKKDDPQDVTGLVRGVLVSAILAAVTILVFYLLHFRGLA